MNHPTEKQIEIMRKELVAQLQADRDAENKAVDEYYRQHPGASLLDGSLPDND